MDQVSIGERIRRRREEQGLSLQDVADQLDVNRSSVMRWENGKTSRIKLPILEKLALILQTSPGYLMGYEDDSGTELVSRSCMAEDACLLPVLQKICPVDKLFHKQNILCYELAEGRYRLMRCFYLYVTGDAMAPSLEEGDRLLIKRQDTLKNGQLGLFLLDEKEYLLRHFYSSDSITLKASNPYYPALRFEKEAMSKRIQIIGVVLESKTNW